MTASKMLVRVGQFVAMAIVVWSQEPASAQALHPSVQFAGDLLKKGQIVEAINTLRPRIDADPSDCRALGLMVLAQTQQHDDQSTELWLQRLQGIQPCSQVAGIITEQHSKVSQKETLAKKIAALVSVGDVDGIEKTITEAEATLGPLATVRAYVDALKGKFPALESPTQSQPSSLTQVLRKYLDAPKGKSPVRESATQPQPPSLSPEFLAALEKRRDQLKTADADVTGVSISRDGGSGDGITGDDRDYWKAAYHSEGHRIGHDLFQVAMRSEGQVAMQRGQQFFSFFSEKIRQHFALAPVSEDTLMELMTLALLSGSPEQIERVGTLMKRAFQEIKWVGDFRDRKGGKSQLSVITLDFKAQKLMYSPSLCICNYPPNHPWRQSWTIPFSEIKELSQSGTRIHEIQAGYKSIQLGSSGLVINNRRNLPLPLNFVDMGFAFGEVAVRQSAREYGAQIARFIGVPSEEIQLINERPGSGAFSFSQMWSAGMQTFSQATGNSAMAGFWSDQLLRANNEAAAQAQLNESGSQAWQNAKTDPLLGHVLEADNFTSEIERVLGIAAK